MDCLVARCLLILAIAHLSVPLATAQSQFFLSERLPASVFEDWTETPPLVGSPSLAWTDRSLITVAFNGGSEHVRTLIEAAASEWIAPGSPVSFSFRNKDGSFRTWSESDQFEGAAIRVAFSVAAEDGGYWSAIGRMAVTVPAGEQTLNLGDLEARLSAYDGVTSEDWLASYDHTVVLHEFGHAIGLAHEHFHPDCQQDLLLDRAIAELMDSPNFWSEMQARFNLDAEYYFVVSKSAQDAAFPDEDNTPDVSATIDQLSVMLYGFANDDNYRSGASSVCRPASPLGYSTSLSEGDKAAFDLFYPG